tara:strand:- start:411 stop:866 length:456 start_codon:yes stop_codon:yes gene_type:complete
MSLQLHGKTKAHLLTTYKASVSGSIRKGSRVRISRKQINLALPVVTLSRNFKLPVNNENSSNQPQPNPNQATQMKIYKITAMTHAPNNSETRMTICQRGENGTEDGYEDVTVTHDRLGNHDEMMSDIDGYLAERQAELDHAQGDEKLSNQN